MEILDELNKAKVAMMKAKVGASGADLDAVNLRLDTIRGVIGEIDKESKIANARPALSIVKSEYTKRIASSELYAKLDQMERSEREAAEAAVLSEYIPSETSEAELRKFVAEFIAANDLADMGKKALGTVMGAIKSEFDNYDGKIASNVARELIG